LIHDCIDVVALTDVGDHSDHLAVVVLFQPGNDDGGIQPSGVGQYNFSTHDCSLWFLRPRSGFRPEAPAPRFAGSLTPPGRLNFVTHDCSSSFLPRGGRLRSAATAGWLSARACGSRPGRTPRNAGNR